MELVDTDMFGNQYEIHREYFKNYAKYDENLETRKFLLNVASFYDLNEINQGCFKFSRLFRYYVFRKREHLDQKKSKKIQKGGNIFDKDTIVHEIDVTEDNTNTYGASICHILKAHRLIPKNITTKEFISDFKINMKNRPIIGYHDIL